MYVVDPEILDLLTHIDLFDLSNLRHLLELKVWTMYVCTLRTVGLFELHETFGPHKVY